jgi:peptidoglycan/xylan/chitin deacetylase (PgdA/CDA1 family)
MSNYIPKPSVFDPDKLGQFGIFGGQYVPETLMPILKELEAEYKKYRFDKEFWAEVNYLLKDYVGRENYNLMAKAGIHPADAPLFIPPYEWYNEEIAGWAQGMGLKIVNFTPGTGSNADYTTPDMKNYRSSKDIFNQIIKVEEADGLNGHLLLVHLGTHPDRTDKFYNRLDKLIKTLKKRGYTFVPLRDATGY